jgi:hypothetical protein
MPCLTSGFRSFVALAAAVSLAPGALVFTGTAQAATAMRPAKSPAQKWTKISSDTNFSIASAGLFRTKDGRLHVLWPSEDIGKTNTTFSLHYSTVAGREKLVNTGKVVSGWSAIMQFPRLVAGPGGGMRAIFTGGNGVSGSPYNTGAIYNSTSSAAGTSWPLGTGSLSESVQVNLTDDAAATEGNGTPVVAWAAANGLAYHVGVDPTIPSMNSDGLVGGSSTTGAGDPTLVRTKSGAILAGWFNSSGTASEGYWTDQIAPSKGAPAKAPNSGGPNLTNGQPFQPVALATQVGGGEYLAYCVPTRILHCSHIALWRVGSKKTIAVPGSASGQANNVAIAAAPGGHLWIAWFDNGTNKVSVVRTNSAATGFGPVLTFAPPASLFAFSGLEAEGSTGPVDLIALEQQATAHSSPAYFDTQVLPALRIKASKSSVSNAKSTTITFTVTDTGDAVSGVTVKFLGQSAKTNAKGQAKFTIKKGTAKGSHAAAATKNGYSSGSATVKVT